MYTHGYAYAYFNTYTYKYVHTSVPYIDIYAFI